MLVETGQVRPMAVAAAAVGRVLLGPALVAATAAGGHRDVLAPAGLAEAAQRHGERLLDAGHAPARRALGGHSGSPGRRVLSRTAAGAPARFLANGRSSGPEIGQIRRGRG